MIKLTKKCFIEEEEMIRYRLEVAKKYLDDAKELFNQK